MKNKPFILTLLTSALPIIISAPALADITLEQAVTNPDWIGPPVETPYWAADGRGIYYQLKRDGSAIRDLYRADQTSGRSHKLTPSDLGAADGEGQVFDVQNRRAAFVRNNDIFIRDTRTGELIQVTRGAPAQDVSKIFAIGPKPLADYYTLQFSPSGDRLQYRLRGIWHEYDITKRSGGPAVTLREGADPSAKPLSDQTQVQLRLSANLAQNREWRIERQAHEAALQAADSTRVPLPVYLGEGVKLHDSWLSPDGRWLLVSTISATYDPGRFGQMPHYITESGYEEWETTHTRIGYNAPPAETLWLVDLRTRAVSLLPYASLPGITDDPLKSVREENARLVPGYNYPDPKPNEARGLQITGVDWSHDAQRVLIRLTALDGKDRWIASVDFNTKALNSQFRLSDTVGVGSGFADLGWLPDNQSFWYVSEETDYAQLYLRKSDGATQALTSGEFEVTYPVLSPDARFIYFRANKTAPYSYDLYRVPVAGGEVQRLTTQQGVTNFKLSPDGRQIAVLHSSAYVPHQLGVIPSSGGTIRALTDTRTEAYKAFEGAPFEIIELTPPGLEKPIYASLYKPKNFDPSKKYPAVLFAHGASIQNTHLYYPHYFREQLFHNYLLQNGYVVLSVDFSGTSGYGKYTRRVGYRSERTNAADFAEAARWLTANASVDAKRIGIYGGSAGGIATLNALFREPDYFAAGAALRPVTDRRAYVTGGGNTPQIDPLSFLRGSAIEHAEGLKGALLISHGVIDDNVFFQDTVRLYQRLIELRKDNFELTIYPLERHGFVHDDAWYDQYRRVFRLFERHLKADQTAATSSN
ncbi:MAG: prolyl oligopeptidase family serine peptidase [Asticcacaulis sp.]